MIKILKEDVNDNLYDTFKNELQNTIEEQLNKIHQEALRNVSKITKEVLNEIIGIEYVNDFGDLYDFDSMDDEDKEILIQKLNNLNDIKTSDDLKNAIKFAIKDYFDDISE